ncbi:MAG: hemin uptake protein HemP [Planctomycetota bacterium]
MESDPRSRPPVYDSQRLLAGNEEVLIRHGGVDYRLRRTRQDKLILTK